MNLRPEACQALDIVSKQPRCNRHDTRIAGVDAYSCSRFLASKGKTSSIFFLSDFRKRFQFLSAMYAA